MSSYLAIGKQKGIIILWSSVVNAHPPHTLFFCCQKCSNSKCLHYTCLWSSSFYLDIIYHAIFGRISRNARWVDVECFILEATHLVTPQKQSLHSSSGTFISEKISPCFQQFLWSTYNCHFISLRLIQKSPSTQILLSKKSSY